MSKFSKMSKLSKNVKVVKSCQKFSKLTTNSINFRSQVTIIIAMIHVRERFTNKGKKKLSNISFALFTYAFPVKTNIFLFFLIFRAKNVEIGASGG